MTQTTPSHSQSAEAAVQRIMEMVDDHGGLRWSTGWDERGDKDNDAKDSDAKAACKREEIEAELRAALTSQQEVAAPVGDAKRFDAWFTEEHSAKRLFSSDVHVARMGWEAASRVPVASLASREQGVEAVGAVPDSLTAWHQEADRLKKCVDYATCGIEAMKFRAALARHLNTAPPSSKTQDDLAGAETQRPKTLGDAVRAARGGDAPIQFKGYA